MIRPILLYSVCLLFSTQLIGQDDQSKDATWENETKHLKYQKKKDYKGPDDWSGSSPSDLQDEYVPSNTTRRLNNSPGSGSNRYRRYSPQQIQKDRQKRYSGFDRGGGGGNVRKDPTVKRPEPPPPPDIDSPDIDVPSGPDINTPSVSPSFWKILLFILLLAALMIIAYLIVKNRKPSDKKVVVDLENDWNPEVITKSELELKLEAAMEREDFRECVRIYFTFILKELIHKGWIKWKKEKTNHHYVMEMGAKPGVMQFMECVRIYDLVWYGDYNIDRDIFEILKPTLELYYKSLEQGNE